VLQAKDFQSRGPVPGANVRRPGVDFVAPARVNLLGEHTDYTGGLVLPIAIPFTTVATVAPNYTNCYRITCDTFPEDLYLGTEDDFIASGSWSDYPLGVLRELRNLEIFPQAFDLHISGDVPLGSGLSSSASIEVASAMAILALAGVDIPHQEIAVLCRRAENNFVGSPCGIMDQFTIVAAKAGSALMLDTRSLKCEYLPMNLGAMAQTQIVVCNSMVKHSIATGEYGTRRRESEEGQAALQKMIPTLRDLGDATLQQLEAARARMTDASFRRCRHIISDNQRVRAACAALSNNDPIALGELMLAGHISERDDFECSCPEIDFLVETASSLQGCYGSRLTGGGFGGCTVNLVHRSQTDSFISSLTNSYQREWGIVPQTYVCEAVDGAMHRNSVSTAILSRLTQ